ncbi:MAG TPA: VWA domain-containing protein [Gemmatimonadota bacterium]|nr:VWA domain-containing protein [Gemmatimonadota bacterium]
MTTLESIFSFFFKYRPLVFQRGQLALGTSFSVGLIVLAGVAVLLYVALAYSNARTRSRVDRAVLGTLRLSVLALLLFCLARPMLLIPTVVPQRNFLGIVIDDSRSMRIPDRDGESRSASVQQYFAGPDSTLRAALEERFMLRFFRFSSTTERVDEVSALTASGSGTDLAQALDAARRELAAVPLAGLVVLTDGADNSESSLTETTLALRAASVPVYTVGLGRERFERDIQLSRVETPRTVLLGSSLAVDLVIEQYGYRRQDVQVNIEDDGRIVAARTVRLPADGESATVRVQFTAAEPGPRLFRFSIAPQADELIAENNARETLIVVEDARQKILYFEGEPRYELKFVRRAVEDDENLQVVALQRTAPDKFLRLDVDGAEELAAGFPRTREELFRYRGLILGSVEASFFTHDQLRMIEEFVGQRGGGLLFLGGRLALERGGYQGTPLADVLPVVLPEPGVTPETFLAELNVGPTLFGRTHPSTQIAEGTDESARRWAELPAVTSVNAITRVKPGASTLLEGESSDLDEPLVVLAHQRYGRGKALALPIQDSWIWQMHADMPLDDMTHETFWQQLLRWLVSYVPDPVSAAMSRDRVGPREPVTITAEVQDETYLKVNNAEVIASVTAPSGVEQEIRMDWKVDSDGEYSAPFVPNEEGLHRVRVSAAKSGEYLGEHTTYVESTELPIEYFDAELRAELLRRVAEETGGRFYTPATIATLPEDVSFTQSGTTVIEERDLWDMPVIFLLLIALLGAEWGYRRRRGLV